MKIQIMLICLLFIPSIGIGNVMVKEKILVLIDNDDNEDKYCFGSMLHNGDKYELNHSDNHDFCLDPTQVWRLNVAAPSVNFFTW